MPGLQEEHGLLAEHLVGRTDELASLEEVLGELHRGRSGAIELVGESGIGRTRAAQGTRRGPVSGRAPIVVAERPIRHTHEAEPDVTGEGRTAGWLRIGAVAEAAVSSPARPVPLAWIGLRMMRPAAAARAIWMCASIVEEA